MGISNKLTMFRIKLLIFCSNLFLLQPSCLSKWQLHPTPPVPSISKFYRLSPEYIQPLFTIFTTTTGLPTSTLGPLQSVLMVAWELLLNTYSSESNAFLSQSIKTKIIAVAYMTQTLVTSWPLLWPLSLPYFAAAAGDFLFVFVLHYLHWTFALAVPSAWKALPLDTTLLSHFSQVSAQVSTSTSLTTLSKLMIPHYSLFSLLFTIYLPS